MEFTNQNAAVAESVMQTDLLSRPPRCPPIGNRNAVSRPIRTEMTDRPHDIPPISVGDRSIMVATEILLQSNF